MNCPYSVGWFPLIKLAKKLKECYKPIGNSNKKSMFPLIKLAKKLKDTETCPYLGQFQFPLIKLAKKLKESKLPSRKVIWVSIN